MKTKSNQTKEEMTKAVSEKLVALRDIRFGVAGSKQKNVKEASNLKKEIARLKTAIRNAK